MNALGSPASECQKRQHRLQHRFTVSVCKRKNFSSRCLSVTVLLCQSYFPSGLLAILRVPTGLPRLKFPDFSSHGMTSSLTLSKQKPYRTNGQHHCNLVSNTVLMLKLYSVILVFGVLVYLCMYSMPKNH